MTTVRKSVTLTGLSWLCLTFVLASCGGDDAAKPTPRATVPPLSTEEILYSPADDLLYIATAYESAFVGAMDTATSNRPSGFLVTSTSEPLCAGTDGLSEHDALCAASYKVVSLKNESSSTAEMLVGTTFYRRRYGATQRADVWLRSPPGQSVLYESLSTGFNSSQFDDSISVYVIEEKANCGYQLYALSGAAVTRIDFAPIPMDEAPKCPTTGHSLVDYVISVGRTLHAGLVAVQ